MESWGAFRAFPGKWKQQKAASAPEERLLKQEQGKDKPITVEWIILVNNGLYCKWMLQVFLLIDVLLNVVIGVIILLSLLLSLKNDVPLDVDGIVTIVLRCPCRIIDVASQGNRYYPILDAFRQRDWLLRIQDRKLLMVVKRELYILCILRRLWILRISWSMINNGVCDVDHKSNNEYEVWQTIDWSWTVDGWEKLKMSTRIDHPELHLNLASFSSQI